jgi:anti-sigma regulatory factor (Ser/Thr protein kinase)
MTMCTRDFAGRPESAREARAWAARWLTACPSADDVVLLLSELVTNAALHSRSAGGTLRVRLSFVSGAWVRCEVRDDGPLFRDGEEPAAEPTSPVTKPGPLAEAGRGLWLVRELAPRSGADGKGLHWFVLPWRPGEPARIPEPRAPRPDATDMAGEGVYVRDLPGILDPAAGP